METVIIKNYTFDADALTITFSDFTSIDIKKIISVTNVTRGKQLYFYKSPTFGGSVTGNVLSLNFNTSNPPYENSDNLVIEYALGNETYSILPSLLRNASANTTALTSYGKGIGFIINTSAIDAATLTLKVQVADHLGNYVDVPGAVTAGIVATGITTLEVYPGITEATNRKASFAMPESYRLSYTISGGTITFSVSGFKID